MGVAMSMGDVRLAISRLKDDSSNMGHVEESSRSESSNVESMYEVGGPANPSTALRCQEKRRSFSLSGLRGQAKPKFLGVPTGVVSLVEVRSRSLGVGE